jgi:hypothetical protein
VPSRKVAARPGGSQTLPHASRWTADTIQVQRLQAVMVRFLYGW